MVLYFQLTTYNSNAFSLLLTPYYFTTYSLLLYYLLLITLLLTPYYFTTYSLLLYYLLLTTLLLTPYYFTTYSLLLTPLLLPPPSSSPPPRTVRRTIQVRTVGLADLLKSDREADLVRDLSLRQACIPPNGGS